MAAARGHSRLRHLPGAPVQDSVNAFQELARAEGLDDIVAGSGSETGVDVGVARARREQDDVKVTDGLARPDFAQNLDARHTGHHDVEDGQPRRISLDGRKGSHAASDTFDFEPCLGQHVDDEVKNVRVVVGDDDTVSGRLARYRPLSHSRWPFYTSLAGFVPILRRSQTAL